MILLCTLLVGIGLLLYYVAGAILDKKYPNMESCIVCPVRKCKDNLKGYCYQARKKGELPKC